MQSLTAAQLLTVWERGIGQTNVHRAIEMLAAAWPDEDPDNLAGLPIGWRDARLLALRERLFGRIMTGLIRCSSCGERIETTFAMPDVRIAPAPPVGATYTMGFEQHTMTFRLPNSRDLSTASECADVDAARLRLLKRCLLTVDGIERPQIDQLSESAIHALVERMASADPHASQLIEITCPCCEHQWQSTLDIASFLYQEISVWAQRLLREIHVLASTYHWAERDILAMSPWRRQFYLQAVGS
jgi:hypothetical protein